MVRQRVSPRIPQRQRGRLLGHGIRNRRSPVSRFFQALQWGRAFGARNTEAPAVNDKDQEELQWGRAFGARNTQGPGRISEVTDRFNEAVPLGHGIR